MRLIQICNTYGLTTGIGRNVEELHEYLIDRGEDSFVICYGLESNYRTIENVFNFENRIDQKTHALLSRLTGLQGYFSYTVTKKVINKIKELNPDIVMLHALHNNAVNVELLLTYLAENHIKTIIVLHDCWWYTGHCCHYTESNCFRWKEACGNCPQKHRWNKSWFFDWSAKVLSDRKKLFDSFDSLYVIGVSDWITKEARLSILQNANEIRRIYNWVDTSVFNPNQYSDAYQSDIICVATGFSESKGFSYILKTAEDNPSLQFNLIGMVNSKLKLPANIHLIGAVHDPAVLASYYASSKLFLNPTIQESFGKTTAEALACGTPAVVFDTTALKELVDDKTGKCVPLGDQASINQAIHTMLENGKCYYSNNCTIKAQTLFDAKKNLKEYVSFMRQIIR